MMICSEICQADVYCTSLQTLRSFPNPQQRLWQIAMQALPAIGSTPRILITRLSAIGDCVHTLPLVPALRSKFPDAFIGWVAQPGGASLLEGLDGLDELIVVPRDWMKNPRALRATRRELLTHQFEMSIDPQSLTKSSLLGWLSGARVRIGFAKGQGRELSPYLSTNRVKPKAEHVVDRYLELLEPLGITQPSVTFCVPEQQHANNVASQLQSKDGLTRFALLNPGAGWNSKLWPHERYAKVAKHLYESHRLRSLVIWAGKKEKAWAEEITELASGTAVLAPDTSLPDLAALCRRAKLFVGSDTGPLHLAAAVRTPCVGMYGPTQVGVCGPYGEDHEALQGRYEGSQGPKRGDDNAAMTGIEVQHVCDACDRILARFSQAQVA